MSHSRTALLVIDAQQSFEHRPYWNPSEAPVFLDRLQWLVDGAKIRQIPVAQIFHVEESGAFSLESGFVKTLASLSIAPDVVFHKQRHSALIGSGLSVWLTERGIQHLIVSGIRTEQCCETTTRHASDCGYSVEFVSEATLTF
jgi:nicotinamidase-related amidase